jgi:phosphoribosylamine--glycine ligase
MRFLGIGDSCDLSAIYLRLLAEGHEVKVYIAEPLCRTTLAGLVTQTTNWRAELGWIRAAGTNGIILFENTTKSRGELQDQLRREGYGVIGGSAYGDRLENDRAFAQQVLENIGLCTCPTHRFSDRGTALAFLEEHPGRYVLKFDASLPTFVGELSDGRDVRAFLAGAALHGAKSFILMRYVEGIEMGVGAYFDGEKFLKPSCLDWEHKRFFPGDLGELTYEMGTVVSYERSSRFHALTLGRMEPLLREGGYCGYINLNTIVNAAGIWPLEFTCRFGYPGYAILDPLQETPWGELFHAMATRSSQEFASKPGFSVGIVLTTPPFPYSRPTVDEPIGLPVLFDESLTAADRRHIHLCEVGLANGQLATSGAYGWTMVVTGIGNSIARAQQNAIALAEGIFVPNVRYRKDIGSRLIAQDFQELEKLGLLDSPSARDTAA